MTDWEPATDAESALRDALHAGDQELYFRILARIDLLLPVSGPASPGQTSAGWGTWTNGGRTHVLAFTSPESMHASLTNHAGPARRVPYHDLAAGWPNQDWWLAINPGLPIEGYLPAWFVAQLARGDVRLPGRTLGARARVEAVTRVRGTAAPVGGTAEGETPFPLPPRPGVAQVAAAGGGRPELPSGEPGRNARGFQSRAAEGFQGRRAAGPLPPRPAPSGDQTPGGLPSRPVSFGDQAPPGGLPSRPVSYGDQGASPLPTRPVRPADGDAGPLPSRPVSFGDQAPPGGLPSRPASFGDQGAGPLPARPVRRPAGGDAGPLPSRPMPFGDQAAGPSSRPMVPGDQGAGPLPARPVRRPAGGDAGPLPSRPMPFGDQATRPLTSPARGSVEAPSPLPRTEPPPASRPAVPHQPAWPESTAVGSARAPMARPTGPAYPDQPAYPAETPRPVETPYSTETPRAIETPYSIETPPYSIETPRLIETPRPAEAARPDEAGWGSPADPDGQVRAATHAASSEPAEQPRRDPDFVPANEVEANLLAAASDGQTDTFLSTLLLARVLVPVPPGESTTASPGQPGFAWRREQIDGQPYVVVFTSPARMEEHLGAGAEAITVKFVQLIRAWPEESWSFSVNPGTPVGATLPGAQIRALATWAAEVGLSDDPSVAFDKTASATTDRSEAQRTVMMQKPVAPTQVAYFLDRGYDRVSGFVHRASEAAHLTTPEQLCAALGLGYPGSPFKPSDDEVYVLRWAAYRPNLYRIPYGGRDESSMRAMQGWMIERPPFRGNGFAPSESSDVIAEFKVDSARLPHGAQMWRVTRDSGETLVATLDADEPRWRRITPETTDEPDDEPDPAVNGSGATGSDTTGSDVKGSDATGRDAAAFDSAGLDAGFDATGFDAPSFGLTDLDEIRPEVADDPGRGRES